MSGMKRLAVKSIVVLSMCFVLLGATKAQAAIFMNFDTPDFTEDLGNGDHAHIFATAFGNVSFNGRIYHNLNNAAVPDHTTGSTSFLRNTGAQDVLTITFDFDVESLNLWTRKLSGAFTMQGEAYNEAGDLFDSGVFDNVNGAWTFNDIDGLGQPLRKLVLYSSNGNGNNFAIDDLTINPSVVPEPASLLLMSSGLMGFVLRRKRS